MASNTRSAILPFVLEQSAADKPVVVKASTAGVKRDGNEIVPTGWQLDQYKRNPVLLWAHKDAMLPVGRCERVWLDGENLMAEVRFASEIDEFAARVEKMVRGGFVNAVSVRWDPLEWEQIATRDNPTGIRFLKQDLLELSFVSVPADQDALVVQRAVQPAPSGAPQEAPEMAENTVPAPAPALSAEDVQKLTERLASLEAQVRAPVTNTAAEMAAEPRRAPAFAQSLGMPARMSIRESRRENEQDQRGLDFGALAAARAYQYLTPGMSVAEAIDALGYRSTADRYQRALSEGSFTAGGSTVPGQFYAGFIDMLDDAVVIRQALVPKSQQLRLERESIDIPTVTSGATYSWLGEAQPPANSTPATGMLSMRVKTGAAEVIISKDLLADSAVNIDALVRGMLLRCAAKAEDLSLVEGTGSSYQPKGLENWAGASAAGTASPTHETVLADLLLAEKSFTDNKVDVSGGIIYIANPAAKYHLMKLAAPSGNFEMMAELKGGTLFGHQAVFSTQLQTDKFYVVVPAECWFAEKMGPELEVDDKYISSGTTYAASPNRQTVLRLWRKFDFAVAHSGYGVYAVTSCPWT